MLSARDVVNNHLTSKRIYNSDHGLLYISKYFVQHPRYDPHD